MKQIIPFVKDINFNSKISEITSIALEHNLKMENNDSIVGDFIVSGKYKVNPISVNEEVFEEKMLFDITLDDKYDSSKIKIDIDDFYYEIVDEEYLRVNINILIDNLEYIKKEEKKSSDTNKIFNNSNIDKEIKNKEERSDNMVEEQKEMIETKSDDVSNEVSSLTSNFLDEKESYSCYKVHIVRGDDTIDSIKEIYNIKTEELEKYNDLSNIIIGSKIIIPISNE